jgi:hypothetical protein
MRLSFTVVGLLALGLALASCASDPAAMVRNSETARGKVMRAIASDSAFASRMADTLLLDDRTREILVEKVANHGEAMQTMMAKLARDPAALDGIIGFAMQESTMKAHVFTLMDGIRIGQRSRQGVVESNNPD